VEVEITDVPIVPVLFLCVHPVCVGIMAEDKIGNCSDLSDSRDEEGVENSFLRESHEMERLEQCDFDDEDGINADNNENM
jgi:hypothetical protein